MSTARAATGNATVLGLGKGRADLFGVPAPGVNGYGVNLPAAITLTRGESESGQVNPSGYPREGIPGPIEGAVTHAHPMTAPHLLEFLEHLCGGLVKTTPEAGVYRYVATPRWTSRACTDFWGPLSKDGVDVFYGYGIAFSTMQFAIGDNGEIVVTSSGLVNHGTHLGVAIPDGANTGTYVLGPWVRGILADPTAGDVWIRIEAMGPPPTFKILQKTTTPIAGDWTAATRIFTFAYDANGEATWLNAEDSAAFADLGIFGENKDPLQVLFPGDATAHTDLAPADVFQIPAWATVPALTEISGTKYTSAHLVSKFRTVGAGTWEEMVVRDTTFTLESPLAQVPGNGSRYRQEPDRLGPPTLSTAFTRSFNTRWFLERKLRHERLEAEHLFEGRRIGAADLRETVKIETPADTIMAADSPPASEGVIEESVELMAKTNDAGDPPFTITVTTDRDFTPTAIP